MVQNIIITRTQKGKDFSCTESQLQSKKPVPGSKCDWSLQYSHEIFGFQWEWHDYYS